MPEVGLTKEATDFLKKNKQARLTEASPASLCWG